jgi:hypothetical protein
MTRFHGVASLLLGSTDSNTHFRAMKCSSLTTAVSLAIISSLASGRAQPSSAGKPNFSGVWTLNRGLSDAPAQRVGAPNLSAQGGDRTDRPAGPSGFDRSTGRGRSDVERDDGYRRERGRPADGRDRRRTVEEVAAQLTAPSPSLTISHADPMLIITNAKDRTHVFRTNRQRDPHQVGTETVLSATRWDGDKLVTEYDLGAGHTLRVTHSLISATGQLLEQVRLANGQIIKHVYDPVRPPKRP